MSWRHCICVALIAIPPVSATADSRLDNQRQAFIDAWPIALEGQLPGDKRTLSLLKDYPLWPDLQAAVYSDQLKTMNHATLERFIQQHATLAPIRRLRYRYATYLGNSASWDKFWPFYQAHYANADLSALDCLALRGSLAATTKSAASTQKLASKLWLVGRSQHDYCDQPFSTLLANGDIGPDLIRERMNLAIDNRQLGLAGYLAGMLGASEKAVVAQWRNALTRPSDTLTKAVNQTINLSDEQVIAAVRKRALSDAPAAAKAWRALSKKRTFSAQQLGETARYIAIAASQDHEPTAATLINAVPVEHRDQRLLEWQTRIALLDGDWKTVLRTVAMMATSEQSSDRWRYWESRALAATGQTDAADALMAALATERSYYGFLAADALQQDYAFAHRTLLTDAAVLADLASNAAIIRARELYAVEQPQRARQEWQRAIRTLDPNTKRNAAILAHQWGWHRDAISILGELKAWDDLDIRYPLAYRTAIEAQSLAAGIPSSLTLGIVRSESLYDPSAKSSAGAWGLMQLIPSTGKRMAGQKRIQWRGIETLKNPETNITLGTHYLAQLNERFGQPALAAAAYNAGPHRVDRWLPETQTLPADIWIEAIAYDETRAYVQRVLAADIVFRWRMDSKIGRLSDMLKPVQTKQSSVASASRL